MTEIEIMKRAKTYIESLAKGIDPLTGNEVKDDDIINNVRISRCLYYTAEVLQKVIDNGGEVQREKLRRSERLPFDLTDEQSRALKPEKDRLFISKVVNIINSQIDEYKMKKLQAKTVNNWLMEKGLLAEVIVNGRSHKDPTSAGEAIGITLHKYMTSNGIMVTTPVYNEEAQQFIFDNIDTIIEFERAESAALAEAASENYYDGAINDGETPDIPEPGNGNQLPIGDTENLVVEANDID